MGLRPPEGMKIRHRLRSEMVIPSEVEGSAFPSHP
jgi:hypothetical protein